MKRLIERSKELKKDAILGDREASMELDSLDHVMELGTLETYKKAIEVAKSKGLKRVIDVGCAYGHQSEIFIGTGVEYVGINDYNFKFWNSNIYEYKVGEFPFKIDIKSTDILVSVMCLTWNIYLYEDDTLEKQCEAMSEYNHVLLYMSNDKIDYVSKYFKGYSKVDDNLIYFWN